MTHTHMAQKEEEENKAFSDIIIMSPSQNQWILWGLLFFLSNQILVLSKKKEWTHIIVDSLNNDDIIAVGGAWLFVVLCC